MSQSISFPSLIATKNRLLVACNRKEIKIVGVKLKK